MLIARQWRRVEPVVYGLGGIAGVVVLWQVLTGVHVLSAFLFSSPAGFVQGALREWRAGTLQADMRVSLTEFAIGLGSSALFGLTLGSVMSAVRRFEMAVDPFLWVMYSSPLIAFYPLFLIWFGIGRPTVIALSFLFGVVPVTVNALAGLEAADPKLLQAARSFGASKLDLFVKIRAPSALPLVLTGLRLGVGRCMEGVIVGELFGSTAGLGYAIHYYGDQLDTNRMFGALIVVVIVSLILTQTLQAVVDRVMKSRG